MPDDFLHVVTSFLGRPGPRFSFIGFGASGAFASIRYRSTSSHRFDGRDASIMRSEAREASLRASAAAVSSGALTPWPELPALRDR